MGADATPESVGSASPGGARGVALTGFMGVGKTTVGRILAARWSWRHVDLDAILAARFGPVARQVEADRAGFRQREADALAQVDPRACVLSLGGGTLEAPGAVDLLEERFVLVWLDAPLAACAARVGDATGRPLWDGAVADLFAARRPGYARAKIRVDGTGSPERVADGVEEALCSS